MLSTPSYLPGMTILARGPTSIADVALAGTYVPGASALVPITNLHVKHSSTIFPASTHNRHYSALHDIIHTMTAWPRPRIIVQELRCVLNKQHFRSDNFLDVVTSGCQTFVQK